MQSMIVDWQNKPKYRIDDGFVRYCENGRYRTGIIQQSEVNQHAQAA